MTARNRRNFGSRVREFRTRRGWSQEKLAELCDLHRTYIGGIERGERNVSLENIVKIAKALDITASELLKGVEDLRLSPNIG